MSSGKSHAFTDTPSSTHITGQGAQPCAAGACEAFQGREFHCSCDYCVAVCKGCKHLNDNIIGILRRAGISPDTVASTSPSYYQSANGMQAWDVIESFELDFLAGNAVKYILRHGKKGDAKAAVLDLEKAVVYLNKRIDKLKKEVK